MGKFTYTGETKDGEKVSMTVEAEDRYAVYEIARTNGHIVSSVTEGKTFSIGKLIRLERLNYYLSRVKGDELVMFTRNISSMLVAGLTLTRALSVVERQSDNPKLKATIHEIIDHINKGDQFYEVLKSYPKIFSKLYVSMVRAGEESGGLAESLKTISIQLERSSNLKKKIKGAMVYPAIVLSVMVIIGVLMMVFVIPTISNTFLSLGIDLPLSTRIIIGTSGLLANHGLLVLLGVVALVMGLVSVFRTKYGRRVLHWTLVRLPVIGTLVKETNSAYTARTLSSLLSSGVDVINAIHITEEVLQNVYYKEVAKIAAEKVTKGSPLSEVYIERSDLYPILVGEMIAVGEETGQIGKMLGELAIFYENEVERKTKDLSTIIEPLLMVVIGSGVGFFAMAMIAPIYSVSDSI